MTAGYLMDLISEAITLGQMDRETLVVFSCDMENFLTPCPQECGVIRLEESAPQINGDGTLDLGGLLAEPIVMFALLPHNENNPHGDLTEDDSGD